VDVRRGRYRGNPRRPERTSGATPGAPGLQRFTFKANTARTDALEFIYARSKPGNDDSKLHIDVTIT